MNMIPAVLLKWKFEGLWQWVITQNNNFYNYQTTSRQPNQSFSWNLIIRKSFLLIPNIFNLLICYYFHKVFSSKLELRILGSSEVARNDDYDILGNLLTLYRMLSWGVQTSGKFKKKQQFWTTNWIFFVVRKKLIVIWI